jgi:membrane protein implicated in regulation of membrane protease activity
MSHQRQSAELHVLDAYLALFHRAGSAAQVADIILASLGKPVVQAVVRSCLCFIRAYLGKIISNLNSAQNKLTRNEKDLSTQNF